MSTDKKGGPPKPFLSDDEVGSELDAWDATFDALHEEGGATPLPPEAPPPAVEIRVPEPALTAPEPSHTIDDFIPFEARGEDLDEPMTLDNAVDGDASTFDRPVPQVNEADFSDVSDDTRIQRPEDDEEVVYTSASRPNFAQRADERPLPDDPIAPPPPPSPAKRTGPAIIRRVTQPSMPVPKVAPSGDGSFDVGDSTRVADYGEIESHAESSRRGDARHKAPTAPPPTSFAPAAYAQPQAAEEDDYEIEIDASGERTSEPALPAPAVAPPPRRTVAHVVRRADKATKPPTTLIPAKPGSEPIIEIQRGSEPNAEIAENDFSDIEAPRPRTVTRQPTTSGEDDFSDVAAAVGASEDGALSDSDLPLRRGHSPALAPPSADEFADDRPAAEHEALIDDHIPTTMLADDAQRGGEDAYIPMAPNEDRMDALDTEPPGSVPSDPPPALADLYPRVKRPTSVPLLGTAENPFVDRTMAADPQVLAQLRAAARPVTPLPAFGDDSPELEPTLDLEAIGPDSTWPDQLQPLPTAQLDEAGAAELLVYEREIPTVDEPTAAAALRVEAGRLCERLGELDRARAHYDAALFADPRATAALRGLRRIARAAGDLVEATRQLDAELAVAGGLERRALGHHRIDLLLASGDQDLARVAVGELLDSAPSDVRALLAQLELAFLDGRADEFGKALEKLAGAVTDNELRAAVQSARAMLAAHHDDRDGATTWFAAAAESDPAALGARLGAIRSAGAGGDAEGAARTLLELARIVEATDPMTTAALGLRAQHWTTGETAVAAARLARAAMPADVLVARVAAESALAGTDPIASSAALAAWASSPAPPVERAYAAARAAELDPGRGVELWATALQYEPGDDYVGAQLRTAYVASEQTQLAIEVDLVAASDPDRERARLRGAFGLIAQGQLDAAIELLRSGREQRPKALALAEALAEALAAAGRWSDRAKLLAELAKQPGDQLDRDVAQLRSALAAEDAVGAAATADPPDAAELQRTTAGALEAWARVLERDPGAPEAHGAAIVLASRIGDADVSDDVLARAQAAERSPWSIASLALRRYRILSQRSDGGDDARMTQLLQEAGAGIDDPRRTVWLELAAAKRNDLGDAASALDERAALLGDTPEAATLRLRAAQLELDTGDAGRATALLRQVEQVLPNLGIVQELLGAARRRSGDRSGPTRVPPSGGPATGDAFARTVREGDFAAAHNDAAAALLHYQKALEIRPGDPLAVVPLVRVATQLRDGEPIVALALAQLKIAEAAGDGTAKAEAYELIAHIDRELRGDAGSAQIALESALQADPSRVDLMHRLERDYTVGDQIGELLRLRRSELSQIPSELARDRAALVMDTANLAERDQRPDAELGELYRDALAADPRHRLALHGLESIVRRAGASSELARLEEQIALYFEGDARSQAAFYTRAGESLAETSQIDGAVQKFGKADEILPGHVPALEAWRQAALKGQLWLDAAEAATRQAAASGDVAERAALHHFAGVVLMDKALIGEQAMTAFRRALDADPGHKDAFMRLRILLEEDGRHDELGILLANRLEHEAPGTYKTEIHRALAELSRNFLNDRETAKVHYREILTADPNDLRAHSAIADIAWEQGEWQEAADALISRARLESAPEILKTLCFRLGLIYADRLVDLPMALRAFQRALTYDADDEAILVRLADISMQAGEWKLALGACERLVKAEADPEMRAAHLHRVARIFRHGFGDMKRAERALNLALDAAPTNDASLAQLVQFYREAGDMTSVRVHLNRVAGTMRVRAANEPKDGIAYRVISRAMAARAAVGVDGSLPIARAAAELAQVLGRADDAERLLLAEAARVDLSHLLRSDADEVLFPRTIQTELRQLFTLLGDRVAKHVGVDLRAYGVGRGDRLRARESAVATHAQDVATGLGFGEIDVYVSAKTPYAMIAEPTSPVSLVLGQAIAQSGADGRGIRFAAGAALKLAQSSLAIPVRLPADELGVLVIALLKLFQPEFPLGGLDEAAVIGQAQKLKRLIPTNLAQELRTYALAIDPQHFHHAAISRDLRIAGLRAGLVAAGSVVAGLSLLAAQAGTDVPSFLADPVAQGLISFALSEDHANIAR